MKFRCLFIYFFILHTYNKHLRKHRLSVHCCAPSLASKEASKMQRQQENYSSEKRARKKDGINLSSEKNNKNTSNYNKYTVQGEEVESS